MYRHKSWNRSGISEVIGTILILGMTVVLFSTIIVWVASIPTPEASTRLDMDGQLYPVFDDAGAWIGANITVDHRGGESLPGLRTQIFLVVEGPGGIDTATLQTRGTSGGITYGIDGPDEDWDVGERWSYTNYSINADDRVSMTVVDRIKSIIIWSEALSPAAGAHPPLFLEKWADGSASTPTIDIPKTRRPFVVFARVTDPDGDLARESVYVYFAFLYGTPLWKPPVRMYDDGSNGDALANDGVFTAAYTWFWPPTTSWDGGIVLFNATDLAGYRTSSRMILEVVEGPPGSTGSPFGGTWNATLGGIGQGDSGPEGDYGYNIFNESGLPTAENPGGTPTRVFTMGQKVYVIARSTVLKNLENINSFILRDSAGNKLYPPTKEFDSRDPTKRNPAFTQTLTDPWYEYQYTFNAPATLGAYPLEFTLKDNAGHAPFFATDLIWVSTGSPPNYPRIVTYRDPNNDGVLSDLVPAIQFKSIEKMYVRLFFKDRDTSATYINANTGDVEMQDYFGNFPVKKRPGISPVSVISLHAYDLPSEKTYVFSIDLLRRNQDPWVPGINWYTLRVRAASDEGAPGTAERYQMLATQIIIDAPLSVIDIVDAAETGGPGDRRGTFWYENSFYWLEHDIEVLPKDAKKPLSLATGDLNGDTKVDVVVGLDAKEITNIVAYYNLDYGTTWRREFVNQFLKKDSYRTESLSIRDLDGDGDAEIVAGVREDAGAGVGVVIFWNDGSWSTQTLRYSEAGAVPNMRSIAIGDVNNDGRPDVVSGDGNGVTDYYRNNVRGSYIGPIAGNFPPGHIDSFDRGVKVGKDKAITWNSLALERMEGVAVNDPTLDIVVENDKDMIIYRTTVTNGVASWTRYDLKWGTYVGDRINNDIQSLAVGDMNNDGVIDIVVGIDPGARNSGVYRLRNNGMTAGPSPTFNTWTSSQLPHTVTDPKDGNIADLGKVKDIALGDADGDGDLDIVWLTDHEHDFLNNLWHYENIGDDPATYVETNIFTDGWFKHRDKAFAVELAYIDL